MSFLTRSQGFSASACPARRGYLAHLALALTICLLVGCKIVIVSGPSTVAVGETVSYVVAVSESDGFFQTPFYVVAEVPAGWDLVSNGWVGTADGLPVAGEGLVVATDACDFDLGEVRPGYQRLHLRPATFPGALKSSDTGEVTLEFAANSQPAGEFQLFFVFGSDILCSVPEVLTVNRRGPEILTLVQQLVDGAGGVAGLGGPHEIAPSPDGRQLYVASGEEASIAVLDRAETTGELTVSEVETDAFSVIGALGPPAGVRVSPDGEFVHVVSRSGIGKPGGITTFSRHPTTGALTFVDRVLDDVVNLAISPDGRHLYAGVPGVSGIAGEVSVYSRHEASGLLTFFESITPGGELAISPDGRHLYATDDSITVYGRNETSGQLTFFGTGPSLSAEMTAISPDGRHLYSVVGDTGRLVVQARNPATGALSPIATIDLITGLHSLFRGGSVAVSPDGTFVVASCGAGVMVFRRDPGTGGLTLAENRFNGDLPIEIFQGPRVLAFVPGGEHLYAASLNDDALLAFRTLPTGIFNDGFESGSISAWSSTVPQG